MSIKDKIDRYLTEEKDNDALKSKIIDFFKSNPKPKDSMIHSFAEKEGIDTHKFEEVVYDILGSFLGYGRSKDFKGKIDTKELKMGIEVEMEHTGNEMIASRIAHDHLSEIPNYYTLLKAMESKAGIKD
jgi:hypothetical protein